MKRDQKKKAIVIPFPSKPKVRVPDFDRFPWTTYVDFRTPWVVRLLLVVLLVVLSMLFL